MSRTTFQLPRERGKQLRRLAAERNEYVTDVIESLIREEYERLGWTLELPDGFEVSERSDETEPRAQLAVEGLGSVSLTPLEASQFADALIAMAEGATKGPALISTTQDEAATLEARRHGKGVAFAINGRRKPLTVGLTRDLGDGLRRCANALRGPDHAGDPRWGSWGNMTENGKE